MCVGLMGVETQLYMEYPHIYMGLYGLNMDYIYGKTMGDSWENMGPSWENSGSVGKPCGKSSISIGNGNGTTIWLFNIAMENHHF
jgi:hypothetical protein